MNLVVIAAVIAVTSAAKLDRTYLPPASAKTAGGHPGELQTPFASKSFNQGLGGIPKGGFENEFKGVVVDAASPGTRASGDAETGLGAPRIAYGSTNSKVGDAAFSSPVAGFRTQNQFGDQSGNENQIPDGQTAGTNLNTQNFAQKPGQSYESQYRSQELNTRDQNANIVRFDSDVGVESYSYSFETDNGISAEESGVATNGVQAQGGYSYTGDDGQVYSVTYTADEGGYQPKGDHLPTPPPIPEEILKSLEQNARDEAAGLVDDGSYDAQKYNVGGDYTENDDAGSHNSRQPAQFGNRPNSDVSSSGSFINQGNRPFVKPNVNSQTQQSGQINSASASVNFGSSPNSFGQAAVSSNAANGFGQASHSLSHLFQQNKPSINTGLEDSENANTFDSPTFETTSQTGSSQNFIQQQVKPQQPSFGKPQPESQSFNGQSSINRHDSLSSSSNNGNGFGLRQPSGQSVNKLGNNEYLPPVNGFNKRPSQSTPQKLTTSSGTTQGFNQFSQTTTKPQDASGSQSHGHQQFGDSSSNQLTNNQNHAGFTSSQNNGGVPSSSKPSFGGSQSFQPLQSTRQPLTELTTPFESNPQSQGNNQGSVFGTFNTQSSHNRPTQSSFANHQAPTSATSFASSTTINQQGSDSRPLEPNTQTASLSNQRPQSSNQFHLQNVGEQSLSQNQHSDAQFASSTQRPIFNQNIQAQGPDDSYYYNQPSKTFSTPNTQASRFPNTPFNQFNRVTTRPSFSSNANAQVSISQGNFPGNTFTQNTQGSSRYPQPPVLSSVAPTSPTQGSTAASFNGITQASASSFTSGAPTPSTQFSSQNSFSSFGRRPTQQINGQFDNQAESKPNQQGFDKQTTALPQSFTNINKNQYQQQNSFQTQQTVNANQQSPNSDDSPAVPSQQYDGEIYEYNKPAETLPPPTEEDKKAGFGQFGRQPVKPKFGQQKAPESSDSQSGSTHSRPQFASQTFGQKTQTSQQLQFSGQSDSRQPFGQQTSSFANAQPTQVSSFAQSINSPSTQSHDQFKAQSVQQFGSRPSNNQLSQSQFNNVQSGAQEESRLRPSDRPCCRKLPSAPQVQSNQLTQSQGQFGVSDFTAQSFKPEQASAQSFAGKGEVFGGPRKPPSFDEETGYHY